MSKTSDASWKNPVYACDTSRSRSRVHSLHKSLDTGTGVPISGVLFCVPWQQVESMLSRRLLNRWEKRAPTATHPASRPNLQDIPRGSVRLTAICSVVDHILREAV